MKRIVLVLLLAACGGEEGAPCRDEGAAYCDDAVTRYVCRGGEMKSETCPFACSSELDGSDAVCLVTADSR